MGTKWRVLKAGLVAFITTTSSPLPWENRPDLSQPGTDPPSRPQALCQLPPGKGGNLTSISKNQWALYSSVHLQMSFYNMKWIHKSVSIACEQEYFLTARCQQGSQKAGTPVESILVPTAPHPRILAERGHQRGKWEDTQPSFPLTHSLLFWNYWQTTVHYITYCVLHANGYTCILSFKPSNKSEWEA